MTSHFFATVPLEKILRFDPVKNKENILVAFFIGRSEKKFDGSLVKKGHGEVTLHAYVAEWSLIWSFSSIRPSHYCHIHCFLNFHRIL